jgi:hypothetical protein
LSRLAALLSFLARIPQKTFAQLRRRLAHARPNTRAGPPPSNKIEFSYLNVNLMVPKIRPIILTLRAQKTDKVSSFASDNDGFGDDVIPSSLP